MKPHETSVTLPHPALPSADWADCFELARSGTALTAPAAAEMMLGHFPLWVRVLMRTRNILVAPLGLQTSAHAPVDGRMIGLFPVLEETAQEIVLGFDDRHLDFRILVHVGSLDIDTQVIRVTTLVHRKMVMGRIYLAVITPFHRMIVVSTLNRLAVSSR